ncbi:MULTISPECIES: hypothetical protein [unclassified Mycobacterium]|uniref:hypothetical protein n=1 Tax=unclassified Mycobacterium TaxID=2642494 RepID=UPI00099300F4|nr:MULTISPECIES: hypothetical protein [unclassified Mycobacterium]
MRGWLWAVSAMAVIACVGTAVPAAADPKPVPDTVWTNPRDIPMDHVSHWGSLARNATSVDRPAFWSANLCFSLGESLPQSPESASSSVSSDESGWTAVQVIAHWPGDTALTDQYASTVYRSLRARLDHCFNAVGAQVTVADLPNGHAATVTLPAQGGKQPQYRLYVVEPPGTGTVAELTVTNAITGAVVSPWVDADDQQVLRSVAAPICRTAKSTAC